VSAFNLTLKKILGRDLENIGKKYIQKLIYLSIFLYSFRNFLCDDCLKFYDDIIV